MKKKTEEEKENKTKKNFQLELVSLEVTDHWSLLASPLLSRRTGSALLCPQVRTQRCVSALAAI